VPRREADHLPRPARRRLGSPHDAEDMVQETSCRVWRGFERFEPRAALQTWL
jgi:RNA polymerase sigma-70 factor (ECF subfamily)